MKGFNKLENLKTQLDDLDDEIVRICDIIKLLSFKRLLKEQQALDEITQNPQF